MFSRSLSTPEVIPWSPFINLLSTGFIDTNRIDFDIYFCYIALCTKTHFQSLVVYKFKWFPCRIFITSGITFTKAILKLQHPSILFKHLKMAAVLPAAGPAAVGPPGAVAPRTTRSGKVLGNPILPPGLKRWYHRVQPVIPANFLKQKIAGLNIDFIDLLNGTHNHTVLRFTFARGPTTRASTLTAAGNVGVQLEFALPRNMPAVGSFPPGDVKCRGVVGPAPNCAHTINIPVFAGHTLRRFLRILFTHDFLRASFNINGTSFTGCRDFMWVPPSFFSSFLFFSSCVLYTDSFLRSQWIYRCSLPAAGLVNLAAVPAPIWPQFNFFYQVAPAGAAPPAPVASAVDWAVYHDPAFVHVLLPGIIYGIAPPAVIPASLGPILLPPWRWWGRGRARRIGVRIEGGWIFIEDT